MSISFLKITGGNLCCTHKCSRHMGYLSLQRVFFHSFSPAMCHRIKHIWVLLVSCSENSTFSWISSVVRNPIPCRFDLGELVKVTRDQTLGVVNGRAGCKIFGGKWQNSKIMGCIFSCDWETSFGSSKIGREAGSMTGTSGAPPMACLKGCTHLILVLAHVGLLEEVG